MLPDVPICPMERRLQLLHHWCEIDKKKYPQRKVSEVKDMIEEELIRTAEHMIVDEKNKVVYCHIPKCG